MDRVLAQFGDVREVATATPAAQAWQAVDASDGRAVLIKRIPETPGEKTRATQALALSHSHIVPTRRWLRDGDRFYVVRDFVRGRNLRQTLSESARTYDHLQSLLDPILDALEYAQSAGLPHGGVSAENVLVGEDGQSLLCDFATIQTAALHEAASPRSLLTADGRPTPTSDFYALCGLYKEFLPPRSPEDEAGYAARERLLRNLSETQLSTSTADELRYKLEAVGKMADLLGFTSAAGDEAAVQRPPKLVCAVYPSTAILAPGGGTTVALSLGNEGDKPLQIESVVSDAVWLNLPARFMPFALPPDAQRDLVWTLSGARLLPGTYQAALTVLSNSGLSTERPTAGQTWDTQIIAVPTLVRGVPTGNQEAVSAPPAADPAAPLPLAEEMPPFDIDAAVVSPAPRGVEQELEGIAVTQEPDPGLVRAGQNGVLHLAIRNIGAQRLRIDKIDTRPGWLVYPGTFQAVWIEPGATQYLGFSVITANLPGGDYHAQVMFVTSILTETLLGLKPQWRQMTCDVRVRVIRGGPGDVAGLSKAAGPGCATLVMGLLSVCALVGGWIVFVR